MVAGLVGLLAAVEERGQGVGGESEAAAELHVAVGVVAVALDDHSGGVQQRPRRAVPVVEQEQRGSGRVPLADHVETQRVGQSTGDLGPAVKDVLLN